MGDGADRSTRPADQHQLFRVFRQVLDGGVQQPGLGIGVGHDHAALADAGVDQHHGGLRGHPGRAGERTEPPERQHEGEV